MIPQICSRPRICKTKFTHITRCGLLIHRPCKVFHTTPFHTAEGAGGIFRFELWFLDDCLIYIICYFWVIHIFKCLFKLWSQKLNYYSQVNWSPYLVPNWQTTVRALSYSKYIALRDLSNSHILMAVHTVITKLNYYSPVNWNR